MFLCSIDSLVSTIFWNLLPLGIKNFSRGPGYLGLPKGSLNQKYPSPWPGASIIRADPLDEGTRGKVKSNIISWEV